MKKIRNFGRLILGLSELACGVLLLINPNMFMTAIIVGVGIILSVTGLFEVIGYFRMPPREAADRQGFAKGIMSVVAGVFCIVGFDWIISTFPALSILLGIALLAAGIFKMQWTVDLLRVKQGKWWISGIGAVLTIATAIVILINPFETAEMVMIFIGIMMVVNAVSDIIAFVFSLVKAKKKQDNSEIQTETVS